MGIRAVLGKLACACRQTIGGIFASISSRIAAHSETIGRNGGSVGGHRLEPKLHPPDGACPVKPAILADAP
jgi:hypothetical protein